MRPLSEIVILDLSMFIAGPFGTSLLADLGARVIKIEPVGGDPVRANNVGPQIGGENAQFISMNHDKESVAIDLKTPRGLEAFYNLVKSADVVYDNFRPAVRKRLGVDFDSLQAVNSSIISCSISGFGQEGEWSDRPAYDLIVQALSGAMTITGSPETGPARIGYQIGDLAGGLYGAISVLAALEGRRQTGKGAEAEVSLLDAQVALLADEVTHHFATGQDPKSWGCAHPHLVPYQCFETFDKPLVVAAVGTEQFWSRLCEALDCSDLLEDERFGDNAKRVKHRSELVPRIAEVFSRKSRSHWLERLEMFDVPSAPVLTVGEAVELPSLTERSMIRVVEGYGEDVRVAGNPVKFVGAAETVSPRRAPSLGADSRRVLSELAAYRDDQIEELFRAGVVLSVEDLQQDKEH